MQRAFSQAERFTEPLMTRSPFGVRFNLTEGYLHRRRGHDPIRLMRSVTVKSFFKPIDRQSSISDCGGVA